MRRLTRPALLAFAAVAFAGGALAGGALAAADPADLARCTLPRGPVDDAVTVCTRLLASDDLNPDERLKVLMARAERYRGVKQYDLAVLDLTAAIELRPDDVGLLNERGNVYLGQARHELALADYTRVIALQPDYVTAYENRANTNFILKRYDEATRDAEEALRLRPTSARAYSTKGNILWARREFAAAVAEYDTGIRLDPSLWFLWRNRANAQRDLGRLREAVADYTEAIDRESTEVNLFRARSIVYLYLGQYAEAARDLRTSVERFKSTDRYDVLRLGLASLRAGGDGRADILAKLPEGAPTDWVSMLMRHVIGQIGREDVLKAAEDPDEMMQRQQRCGAAYVFGMLAMVQDNPAAARRHFRDAVAIDRTDLVCYTASRHELARIDAKPGTKTRAS